MTDKNYLIDSSVVIDYLNNYKKAVVFIESLSSINISVITQAELLEGSRNKQEMKIIKKTISSFSRIYPSEEVCQIAISYLENYFLRYGVLFDDCVIAATAIENNLVLATTEKKHFKPIKSLKLYYPY